MIPKSNRSALTYSFLGLAVFVFMTAFTNSNAVASLNTNSVNKSNKPVNISAIVWISSPVMNADIERGADIILAAECRSKGAVITKVEFFDDNKIVGSVTKAPYEVTYHLTARKLNYKITARATDADGNSFMSSPVTCVAGSKVQHQYKFYDYAEKSATMQKDFRLCIPEGLTKVRGILVVTDWSNGDSRDCYKEAWYSEFLYLHGFAFLGATGTASHMEAFQMMQHVLIQMAKDSQHPEIATVPFVTTGFSSGGGFASYLLVHDPTRVIASVPVCARLNFTGVTPSSANLHTPACIISGEQENFEPVVLPVLEAYRPLGAMFGWMTVQGTGHGRVGQEVLAMPFLDAVTRLRYPSDGNMNKGSVPLKSIDPGKGWIGDNTTWKSVLTTIIPSKQFKGDAGSTSWLPSEDIAFIYRAYATYDKPLTITSPSPDLSSVQVWDPGSNITVVVDDTKFLQWTKLEFYDGAHRLGIITHGLPQFTAMNLTSGFHVFSVLGTDSHGIVRTSNPVLVVVRMPPIRNDRILLQ